jgi:hypothetical protein
LGGVFGQKGSAYIAMNPQVQPWVAQSKVEGEIPFHVGAQKAHVDPYAQPCCALHV